MTAPWTTHEDAALKFLAGLPFDDIAKIIRTRTARAIETRLQAVHRFRTRQMAQPRPASPPPPEAVRVTITKPETVVWYALGWRLADFENGLVVMEWRQSSAPEFVG